MDLNLQKKNKKKISIKRKIMIPFLYIILALPIITLLIFNITVRQYISSGITNQLESTAVTTEAIIKKELNQIIYETDSQLIEESINNLNRVLAGTTGTLNTELLLYLSDGQILYPISLDSELIPDGVLDYIGNNIEEFNSRELQKIKFERKNYAVVGYKITSLPLSTVPVVVFISSMSISDPLFAKMNLILFILLFGGMLMGIGLSFRISRKVATPIKDLTEAAKEISERKPYNFSTNTNIKEITELNTSIDQMAKKLNNYHKAQIMFLQNASHELKSPLMSIEGYAQGIEKNLLKDNVKAASIIYEESKRLEKIIDDLLQISRIENQNYSMESKEGNIAELTEEYIEKIRGIAIKEGKSIKYVVNESDIVVKYNEILLSQCVLNVLSNAIRYAKEKVVITVLKDKSFACIRVCDDGKGIRPEAMGKIFDRFFKGEDGQTGLGLSIALSAVKAMNGDLVAYNSDKGACFEIRLKI